MGFRANLSRAFRWNAKELLKTRRDSWQKRGYLGPIPFQCSSIEKINFEVPKRAVKAILVLSYKPKYRLRLTKNTSVARNTENEGFFAGVQDAILIFARIFVIGSIATGLAIAYLITRFTHGHVFPIVLRKGIEFLGPICIKFGQWAATRKDLFPEDVCRTLSELQRTASTHSWIYTKQLLRATYGSNWRDVFVKFEDKTPIGSGCCAQVYKAWVNPNARAEVTEKRRISTLVQMVEYLRLGSVATSIDSMLNGNSEIELDEAYNGKLQPVAVKVLHPGIKGQLRRDLSILRGISKCATYVVPQLHWLSLTDCIDQFSQIMENQVDMNLEAANLMKFSKNFSGKENVLFPCPYTNFTHREILVESFHEGSPISDYLEYTDNKLQGKLAKIGIKAVLKMVFKDNFIHCDLHPGNILVQTNHEPPGRSDGWFSRFIDRNYLQKYPKLIILDCGLVVSLNDTCLQNLRDVFRSVLMGNGELAAEYILEHSSHASPDPDGFKSTMRDIVNGHLRNRVNVNVSTVVSELFSAMVRHRVKQDGSFSSVILSMVVIEGLGRTLDPNIDIFTEVLPFVFTYTLYDD